MGVIALLLPVLFWIIRWAVNRVVNRLDCIIKQNADMNDEIIRHKGELKMLAKDIERHDNRLNDHAYRIRGLEKGKQDD